MAKAKPKKKPEKKFHEIKGELLFDKRNQARVQFLLKDATGLLSTPRILLDPKTFPPGAGNGTYFFRFEVE